MPVHYGLWEAVMCVLVLMSRKNIQARSGKRFYSITDAVFLEIVCLITQVHYSPGG